jgi:hypothetical protein
MMDWKVCFSGMEYQRKKGGMDLKRIIPQAGWKPCEGSHPLQGGLHLENRPGRD